MNLSERIRTILAEQGVSQVELARAAGVSKTAVGLWKNGPTLEIDYQHALKIGKAYGYNPEWIAYDRAPKYSIREVSPEMREIIDELVALDIAGGERREDVIFFIKRLLPKKESSVDLHKAG
jgi:transcriptional regulator with XRE-family HTH domain